MSGILMLLLLAIGLIILGLVKLISGKKKISNQEYNSPEYKKGMSDLKVGIGIFILISVLLLIGFSMCFGILAGEF